MKKKSRSNCGIIHQNIARQVYMATEEQKKKMIQKRLNPGNNGGTEEDPKKRPRVSIYWIYCIIFAAIIGYNLYRNTNGGNVPEIKNTQFFEMLQKGDVDY